MDDTLSEEKLSQHGFTQEEIHSVVRWAKRDNVSFSEMLKTLRRVFVGSAFIILALSLICISEFFRVEGVELYAFFFAYFTAVAAICFFAPGKSGAKVYFFLKNYEPVALLSSSFFSSSTVA